MNRCHWTIVFVAVGLLLASPRVAWATVQERDWRTPGDRLLTYDELNQREWLDLTQSRLAIFPGDAYEERYQQLLLELAPGGHFGGFVVAKDTDLYELAASAGIAAVGDIGNEQATRELIRLVGASYSNPRNMRQWPYGLLDGAFFNNVGQFREAGVLTTGSRSAGVNISGVGMFVRSELGNPETMGVWLFRAVPEPSTRWPTMIVAVALSFAGRHRRFAEDMARKGAPQIAAAVSSELSISSNARRTSTSELSAG
jgi:hypothetical protein